jgi:hypothetical protein
MSTLSSRRAPVALVLAGALLIAGLAVASEAHARIIWACVKQVGGSVHIVDSGTKCGRSEVKLSWTGATGAQGRTGPAGAAGANGANGANGARGATGESGAEGAQGVTGASGTEAGAEGVTGEAGPTGPTGPVGPTGVSGSTGASGGTGSEGASGDTGATGPAGSGSIMGGSGSIVAASTTVFTGLDAQSASEATVEQIMPTTQTFTKFYCFGPTPATSSDVFTVRVAGVSQAATCTVPAAGTTVVSASVNVTINAGELFDVEVAQGDAAGAVTWALAP